MREVEVADLDGSVSLPLDGGGRSIHPARWVWRHGGSGCAVRGPSVIAVRRHCVSRCWRHPPAGDQAQSAVRLVTRVLGW